MSSRMPRERTLSRSLPAISGSTSPPPVCHRVDAISLDSTMASNDDVEANKRQLLKARKRFIDADISWRVRSLPRFVESVPQGSDKMAQLAVLDLPHEMDLLDGLIEAIASLTELSLDLTDLTAEVVTLLLSRARKTSQDFTPVLKAENHVCPHRRPPSCHQALAFGYGSAPAAEAS